MFVWFSVDIISMIHPASLIKYGPTWILIEKESVIRSAKLISRGNVDHFWIDWLDFIMVNDV